MLSNVDILEKISNGDIRIVDPNGVSVINTENQQEREPGQFQAHGYDLRVDAIFDWRRDDWHEIEDGEEYSIQPHQFVVIRTYERLCLNHNIAATINSMARRTLIGLIHISTTIHPGWCISEEDLEPFYIAVTNVSKAPIKLKRKETFCRVLFFEMNTVASLPSPSLGQVRKNFDNSKFEFVKRYRWYRRALGWILLLVTSLIMGVILFGVQSVSPQALPIAIPLVVLILSLVLTLITRRFNILQ